MIPLLFICFFLSGAAALVYEVVWMRMLTQIFGSSAYAVATVLAAFMAGLALGSYVFGRLAARRKNLLRLYGMLEVGIGIYGVLAPLLFRSTLEIYTRLFWLYDREPALFTLLLLALSFVLLILPTFLMGATLPLLSQYFVRSFSHLGQRIGDLYGTNTLGAVFGCSIAGYYLIPQLGMSGAVYTAAAANLLIGGIMIFFGLPRRASDETAAVGAASANGADAPRARTGIEWLLLLSIAISGAAAMVYENAWTHALALVIGGSVYSFTTMLLTFLVGLAAGGYLYARLWGKREVRASVFGLLELAVGCAALATIPLFEKLPLIFLRLHEGFGDVFQLFLASQVAVAFLVMFLPALLLGMTFPLVVCLFTQNLYRVGSGVGTTYAANTVGAIVGAFAGGFILLPRVGMQNAIVIGALLNLAVGWALLIADPRPGRIRRLALGGVVAGALAFFAFHFPFWDRAILTSGVTVYAGRYHEIPTDSLRLEEMHRDEILYYREGLTATVSVHQSFGSDYRYLKTNGKVDGSYGDALTMLMTGYLPMLLHPEAKQVAVIGLGTGMTIRAVGAFPVEKIEMLEIEPAMVEAARFFAEKNGKILDDPRVRVIPTDGRNYIMAVPRLYDLIISEPSNPWIAGIASLFTKEFYAVAKNKLKPDGVFAQWIHNYSMSPDDFRMVLRTFGESFPHISVWNMQESDFLLVGSSRELQFDFPRSRRIFADNPALRGDLRDLGLSDIDAVLGFYRMGKKELLAMADRAEINTDDNARLEFSAPRSLGKPTSELNRKIMEPFVVAPPWTGDALWAEPARRNLHRAQALYASNWYDRALEEVDAALRLQPADADAHLLRAKILVAQENTKEATIVAQKVLELAPDKIKQVLALVEELSTTEGKIIYEQAAALHRGEILPYLGLANIALFRKQLDEAERWLREAEKMQPKHAAVLFALGKLAAAKGNYPEAVAFLEEAGTKEDVKEDSAAFYAELGKAYSQLKQWEKAVQAFQQALRTRRRSAPWRVLQAQALAQLGRTKEAELKYREALAVDSSSTEAWLGLKALGKHY